MRSIGVLKSHEHARRVVDTLRVQGIVAEAEAGEGGSYTVWVVDEDQLEAAARTLERFSSNPDADEFAGNASKARAIETAERAEAEAAGRRVRNRREIVRNTGSVRFGIISSLLLLGMVAGFSLTQGGDNIEATSKMFIGFAEAVTGERLQEIRAGEYWRVLSPVFLHFGWIHLFCNAMWVLSLGALIEARRGPAFFLPFVFVAAAIPNLAEYFITGNPFFGGMSGVTFAFTGYAWVKGNKDPGAGIHLDPATFTMVTIYFVLCWAEEFGITGGLSVLGIGGRVANIVHTAGLVLGAAWAWADSRK
ncbi:MAG: rhomboid family intramembrane serine protease [Verrucomicrobia bacterium]|nr:rhomboid family intramembrane serine protease [Verrucomicrobiota bacterium]